MGVDIGFGISQWVDATRYPAVLYDKNGCPSFEVDLFDSDWKSLFQIGGCVLLISLTAADQTGL